LSVLINFIRIKNLKTYRLKFNCKDILKLGILKTKENNNFLRKNNLGIISRLNLGIFKNPI